MAKQKKQNNTKLKAFVASFFTIVGFLLAIILWKNEEYIMYYAKHGLVLFIGQIIIALLHSFPFGILTMFITLLWIFWVILWVLTWVNALSGQKKKTFIVTDLAEKINL